MKTPLPSLLAALLLAAAPAALAEPCAYAARGLPECETDGRLPIQPAQTASGRFAAKIIFLADQLERNIDRKNPAAAYLVASFGNLNDLAETSPLGRLIAENLMHELQVRNWKIYEARLMKSVLINGKGEFSLSRDVRHLRDQYSIAGVVTGTYVVSDGDVIVNARVIDTATGLVISSGQTQIPSNWFTDALLHGQGQGAAVKIVGG